MLMKASWVVGLVAALGVACGPGDDPGGDGSAASGESGIVLDASAGTSTPADDTAAEPTSTAGDDTTTSDPPDPGGPVACNDGVTYQCGDEIDNDGDGLVDGSDPECTGPCDDDESSFQTGIPGDNVDCFQDCFFDGNSGHEDDMCWWNITCDPSNPGEGTGCEYVDSPMCMMEPPYDNSACLDNCLGQTPNGCDCYGCCSVDVDGEEIHVWLGSGPDCSLTNLDACTTCTPNPDCSNDCSPDDCELCFGEDSLPEGCDDPSCPEGQTPCTSTEDCGDNQYCLTGCCIDYVPPS